MRGDKFIITLILHHLLQRNTSWPDLNFQQQILTDITQSKVLQQYNYTMDPT